MQTKYPRTLTEVDSSSAVLRKKSHTEVADFFLCEAVVPVSFHSRKTCPFQTFRFIISLSHLRFFRVPVNSVLMAVDCIVTAR